MAGTEKIINNPSITSGNFTIIDGKIVAISNIPVAGGGGTIVESDFIWKPVINQDGTLGWARDTSATTPATADLVPHIYNNYWYIGTSNTNVEARGPQGEQGEQGIQGETGPAGADGSDGTNGKTPELRINPSNAEWQWKYTDDVEWINLGVTASGAVGPQGPTGADGKSLSAEYEEDSVNRQTQVKIGQINGSEQTSFYLPWGVNGTNGTNGTSLSAKTSIITGGHRVEIWEKGASQYDDSFNVMDGEDGVSPTVTITNIPADPDDPNHKNGGTEITITDATATNKFSAWNGNDGTMAGAPDIEGKNGISAALDGSTYKVGLSATFYNAITSVSSTYATKDALDDYLTKNDAAESYQPKGNYATTQDISDMATKTWVEGKHYLVADDITGKADKTDLQYVSAGVDYVSGHIPSLNGYATEQYVQGASAEVTAWVGQQNYLTSVSANNPISGNGTNATPLGLDMTDAYTIDGTNGITAVPDATTNKVVVQMTNDVYQDVQHLHTSASEWDKISGLSAKSNVNITSAGVTTVTNTSGTTENKFTQYAEVASHPTPRMFLCATADTVEDITGVLTAASGMGAIVFVIESHS